MQTARGQEAFAAVAAMLDDARGWRLAKMRKRRGMTKEQVAIRMGVSAAPLLIRHVSLIVPPALCEEEQVFGRAVLLEGW